MIKNDEISLVINTTEGRQSMADSYSIRRNALQHKITSTTTLAGGEAICMALKFGPKKRFAVSRTCTQESDYENIQ